MAGLYGPVVESMRNAWRSIVAHPGRQRLAAFPSLAKLDELRPDCPLRVLLESHPLRRPDHWGDSVGILSTNRHRGVTHRRRDDRLFRHVAYFSR